MNDLMVRLSLASSAPAVLPYRQAFDLCGSCAFTPACMPLGAALLLLLPLLLPSLVHAACASQLLPPSFQGFCSCCAVLCWVDAVWTGAAPQPDDMLRLHGCE